MVLSALGTQLLPACKKQEAAAASQPSEPPVHVDTVPVTAVKTPKVLLLTGTLRGAKEADLAANVAGRVLSTSVEAGQNVTEGMVLATVDVRAAALALAEARVMVDASRTQQEISQVECERYEKLKQSGAVTPAEYDQVTAKCKTAPLSVQAAEARQSIVAKNVGDGVIRSPFSGTVTERYVEVGEYVQPASRVVSLAKVDDLRLSFSLPEKNWPDVRQDAEVAFRVVAYPTQVFTGRVVHISGAVRQTRDVLIEAAVSNTDRKLLPGMFAAIQLTIGYEDLPAVPKTAVFLQNGKQNVLIVNGSTLEQRVIQPADAVADRIPVRRGVALGEKVVSVYSDKLRNGQSVN
ncbi:MAG: efflux RND transporter periplasmic adaptor subunit [Polyangiaceae bacterium]|nr:efflux RND transporter periplasmic adaptor subunit [Polyangiaceae bacterium]